MTEQVHFSGIGGAGMNPLARLLAARGHRVQGSDRDFDRGRNPAVAELLQAAGIRLVPQDGSGIHAGLDRLVHSTAVEADTPEMLAARSHGVRTQTRPALLAEVVGAGRPGVAVAGTSGKSTVVGLLAWLLRQAGREATVLGGAALAEAGANHMGCFAAAGADAPVIAEACESDGTLVGYHAGIGLVHNVSRDHQEVDALRQQFGRFAAQATELLINNDCPEAAALGREHPQVLRYGQSEVAAAPWRVLELTGDGVRGELQLPDGPCMELLLPQPGLYMLENGVAAALLAWRLGLPEEAIVAGLRSFPGVARRYQLVGRSTHDVLVVDDYAHNGAKIAAVIQAAQASGRRLLVIFQPHGFGPARFLRPELAELWPRLLEPADRLCYAEIYFAGGTVSRDLSARDLAGDLQPSAAFAEDHAAVIDWVRSEARPGDLVLLLGARDPRLPELARSILEAV